MKRRVETSLEIERTTILHHRGQAVHQVWCDVCAAEVGMVTIARAARLTKSSERTIFKRIEQGALHFVETPERQLLICLRSLAAQDEI